MGDVLAKLKAAGLRAKLVDGKLSIRGRIEPALRLWIGEHRDVITDALLGAEADGAARRLSPREKRELGLVYLDDVGAWTHPLGDAVMLEILTQGITFEAAKASAIERDSKAREMEHGSIFQE